MPGPVIFGAVTDTACRVWQTECGENTSCWIYDSSVLSRNYFLIAACVKVLSIVFFSLAFWLYKPPSESEEKFSPRESARKQMSFVNGSFRESEYEHNVLDKAPSKSTADAKHDGTENNKTTSLWQCLNCLLGTNSAWSIERLTFENLWQTFIKVTATKLPDFNTL